MKMELDNVASKTILHLPYWQKQNNFKNKNRSSYSAVVEEERKIGKKIKKKDTRVFFSCVRNYFLPCIKYMDIISQQGFGGSFNSSTAQ